MDVEGLRVEMRVTAGTPVAEVEYSVPGRLRGCNAQPATLSEVQASIEEVRAILARYLDWAPGEAGVELVRVDITRDFHEVADPARLIEQISHVRGPRGAITPVWRSEDGLGAEGMHRRTERWMARLYDRGAKAANLAAVRSRRRRAPQNLPDERGTVRFEAQLRRRRLRELGVMTVGDVSHGDLEILAEHYFHHARYGEWVGHPGGRFWAALEQARANGDAAYKQFYKSAATLMWESTSVPAPIARNTRSQYRKVARAYGLNELNILDPGPARRLDLRQGRVVEWTAPNSGTLVAA